MNELAGLESSAPHSSLRPTLPRVPATRGRGTAPFFRCLALAALVTMMGCGGVDVRPDFVGFSAYIENYEDEYFKVKTGYVCKPMYRGEVP